MLYFKKRKTIEAIQCLPDSPACIAYVATIPGGSIVDRKINISNAACDITVDENDYLINCGDGVFNSGFREWFEDNWEL